MLSPPEGVIPANSNTSSESDTTPSHTPSHSPSPARSIKSRFARQYRSKRAQSKDDQKYQSSPSASPHSAPSASSTSSTTQKKKKKKNKKTVLVFINSSKSKSKSARSLFNLAKKKGFKGHRKGTQSVSSIPDIHSNSNSNPHQLQKMANQYDEQRRHTTYTQQSSFPYYNNSGNGNPSKINIDKFSRHSYAVKPVKTKPLPQKPYIVNDDNHQHHHRENNNNTKNQPPLRRSHAKSRSAVGVLSPSGMQSRSKSPSPSPARSSAIYSNSHNLLHSQQATKLYTGCCPHCNHETQLIDFINITNRRSHLTELRDKLAAVESLAHILKQQILDIQSQNVGAKVSDSSINGRDGRNGKVQINQSKKQVSNPYHEESSAASSYHLQNLTLQQQQALSLLTEHKNVTFPIKGTAMISPQDNIQYFDKFKEMRRRFMNQDFFVGLDLGTATFAVHTKIKAAGSNKDNFGKQYRQVRSFSSLNGAEFESAKNNVLKIWFKNTRGYFLLSFASETEANTVLNLVNIIVNNPEYNQNVSNQLVLASYVEKKGKRMRMYSQRFLALINLEIKLYKTHINYKNGEEPSQMINLMECDLSRDKQVIKFTKKKANANNGNSKTETFLSIKLTSEIERDDFLNLCAQTLGKAIQNKKNGPISPSSPNQVTVTPAITSYNDHNDDDDSGTDIEESEFYIYNDNDEKSEYRQNESIGHDLMDDDNPDDILMFKSMTMSYATTRGPPANMMNLKNKDLKHADYLEKLNNTPRMYGASSIKALDRLAKKRPSDIDFIETTFKGNEIVLKSSKNDDLKTYQLLDVLGKSMISGAFLNKQLYLHKAVWEQNKVMVVNYEKKLEIFNVMLLSLNNLLNDINIDWLKSDFKSNSSSFHQKLVKCEKKLRDAQNVLTEFITKHQQKAKETGAAKFLTKFKDKSRQKVFDNQPYRDLIYKICGHASTMEVYYKYLAKSTSSKHEENRKLLLNDLKGITLCMASFARVVVADIKEFLSAYLRRGAKNIYQ